MKPVVSVTNIFPEVALKKLSAQCDLRLNESGISLNAEELRVRAAQSTAMITYLSDKIDKDIIEAGKSLTIIANYGAGFNNIDVPSAEKMGVWVTNTPRVLHETTADLTWAMILGGARRIVSAEKFTRDNKFRGWQANLFLGTDVFGKTLGVIGCGEIGRAVARRAKGFEMKVLYYQRNRLSLEEEERLGAVYTPLRELIQNSDFITLHIPLTEETRYLIGEEEFELMKPSAYLIHTARGKVVDDSALLDALREGRIAGAALDVYENEPELTEGMTELENLMLLPHIGSASVETRDRMALLVAENILDALSGKSPRSLVPGWGG